MELRLVVTFVLVLLTSPVGGTRHIRARDTPADNANHQVALCPNVSSCAECVLHEHCGWCGSTIEGEGQCVHGSEFAPSPGAEAQCSCWKFTRCAGPNANCFSEQVSPDNADATTALKARYDVYKEDYDYAQHTREQLDAHGATLDSVISRLKLKLDTCQTTLKLKSDAADTNGSSFRKTKQVLDEAEREVSETLESLQQERSNADKASTGKAAILKLVKDLEMRLKEAKKKETLAKEALSPAEQKKNVASLDRDQQAELCEQQELQLKKAEIRKELIVVNQQYRRETESARKHDTQTIQSILEHGIPGDETSLPQGWVDKLPLGKAPNGPLVAKYEPQPPSPQIPSVGDLSDVNEWFEGLLNTGNRRLL